MVHAPPTLIDSEPPDGGWPDHPLFSLENVYRAYRQCRRRKRGTINALRFEQHLEENLVALSRELRDGTYRPGRFLAFLLEKPKRREIFAADFRDRVVHHVLVGHQEPRWERRFIHDSFACRKGKGTLAGVERLRSFTRKVTANSTRRAFYLQLDVKSFPARRAAPGAQRPDAAAPGSRRHRLPGLHRAAGLPAGAPAGGGESA